MWRTFVGLTGALVLATPALAEMENVTLYRMQVEGMMCPFCAYHVEQRFNAMDHVSYVDVNVDEGRVVVAVEEDNKLTRSRVARLYENAGFTLKNMETIPVTRENLANKEA